MSNYNTATDPPISYISFVADSNGRGDFYVDNAFSPAVVRHRLDVDVVGSGGTVDVGVVMSPWVMRLIIH